MEDTVWNSLEITKLVVNAIIPLAIVFAGYWFNRKLRLFETRTQQELGKSRDELERLKEPWIELRIDCQFHGIRQGHVLASFLVLASNRGKVMHKFPSVILRVRGIKDESFQYWEGREPRAYFPYKIFEVEMIPGDWNFMFVEPGVSHELSFTTLLPVEFSVLLAHVEFEYKEYWTHSAETVFVAPDLERRTNE